MKFIRLFALLFLLCLISACSKQEHKEITSISQLNDPACTIGYPEGHSVYYGLKKNFPKSNLRSYTEQISGYESIKQGKIDAFASDRLHLELAMKEGLEGLKVLDENIDEPVEVAAGLSPVSEIPDLEKKINSFLEELRSDGRLSEMYQRWISGQDEMPEIPEAEHPVCHLVVGTSGKVPPHSYYKGVELVGFDIELSRRFALWLNADLEFKVYNYGSIIAAALSGDIDCIFADLNVTPERKEKIGFSSPIYLIENTFLVRDSDSNSYVKGQSVYDSDQNDGFQRHSFLDGLKSSFEKTFLRESRWKLILNGIKITVIISILSALLGTILGFGICGLRLSRKKILNEAALVYIRLIQGLPMVVFLMVLFYIVFGKTGISGLWVAIIGFGMNFSAYVSEMIRTGILAVDKGQMEAALALGYTKSQAFIKIVFPQAACHFLPVFQGEFISLVKMTSVVGYIAIQDLTMAGDIIRSRTYEAFFPLITTAAIYFVIAWLLTRVLVTIQNRVNPKKRRK